MPIDPGIALQVKTPAPIESPLDSLAKVLQIKNAQAQQALIPGQIQAQQQQLQAGQQENQTRQQALDEYSNFKQSLAQNGGDFDATLKDISSFPNLGTNIKKQQVEINKNLADTADLKAKADQANHALAISKLTEVDQALQGLDKLPPNQVDAEYQARKARLDASQHDTSSLPAHYDSQAVAGIHAQVTSVKDKLEEAKEAREAEKQANEAPGQKAKSQQEQLQAAQEQRQQDAAQLAAALQKGPDTYKAALEALPYGRAKAFEGAATPEQIRAVGMTAEQQQTAANQAAERAAETQRQQETGRHNKVEEQQGAARVANEQTSNRIRTVEADPFGQFGLNKNPIGGGVAGAGGGLQTGEDYLRTLPAGMAAQVKAIAEGRQNPPPRASSGVALQIMNAVNQYDPQFSLQRAQIRKAFTTANDGRNIGALNTAAVHLDQFGEAAAAMNNGSFRPGNQTFNMFKNMFGDAAPTNFEGIKAAVSSEMASALKGNATDQEINAIKSTIDKSASPAQLAGAIKTNLDILGAKLNTYQERYKQQLPDDNNWSPVMPTARAVFDKHGINPTAGPASVNQGGGRSGGARPTATDAKGNKVEWNGTAWTPIK